MTSRRGEPTHAFVDETKAGGLALVAALVPAHQLAPARKRVEALRLPGQHRFHAAKERDRRRQQMLDVVIALDLQAIVIDARSTRREDVARRQALGVLARRVVAAQVRRVVLELADSYLALDRRALSDLPRAGVTFEHERARSEPLLWVPDLLGWCWQRGGHWRRALDQLDCEVEVL